jgi:HK97 family phage major capsid protein
MDPVLALKARKVEATKALDALIDGHVAAALAASRGLTDEEKTAQAAAKAELAGIDELLAVATTRREEQKRAAVAADRAGTSTVAVDAPNFEQDPKKGFKSHADFLATVRKTSRTGATDERIKFLSVEDDDAQEPAVLLPVAFNPPGFRATVGSDEQGVYSDPYGGYAVGKTMLPGMLQVGFEGDPTAGRTQTVPMATPMVEMLARTDKNHTTSVSGGFTVSRRPETAAAAASRGQIEMVTLKATSVFGLAYATEELLSDSFISFVALIQTGFKDQFAHHMLNEKLRGGGGNEYLGILTALAASSLGPTISVAKETSQAAATILGENVLKMSARAWRFGNSIWLANHTTKVQLYKLNIPVGVGGTLLFQPSREVGFPDMLLGRPVFYTEYASAVGTQGDLILADFSQYLEGTYQPLQSAESIHVRFVNHERTFKFWLRNAGAPWWKTALTPFKGSDTLSPFVVLDTRA